MSKPAVGHMQLLRKMRLNGRPADTKQAKTRTMSARHNRSGTAGEDGGLTSLPRAAHDVRRARRPLSSQQ